jgi:phosphodiesterase/alkaline phosphatase D-like protein
MTPTPTATATPTTTPTPAADTTQPTLSNVRAGGLTGTTATITWKSNEPADSQVEYGTTTSYGSSTTLDSRLVTSHSVPLDKLTPNTVYHYRVKSKDASGNVTVSADFTFKTRAK